MTIQKVFDHEWLLRRQPTLSTDDNIPKPHWLLVKKRWTKMIPASTATVMVILCWGRNGEGGAGEEGNIHMKKQNKTKTNKQTKIWLTYQSFLRVIRWSPRDPTTPIPPVWSWYPPQPPPSLNPEKTDDNLMDRHNHFFPFVITGIFETWDKISILYSTERWDWEGIVSLANH